MNAPLVIDCDLEILLRGQGFVHVDNHLQLSQIYWNYHTLNFIPFCVFINLLSWVFFTFAVQMYYSQQLTCCNIMFTLHNRFQFSIWINVRLCNTAKSCNSDKENETEIHLLSKFIAASLASISTHAYNSTLRCYCFTVWLGHIMTKLQGSTTPTSYLKLSWKLHSLPKIACSSGGWGGYCLSKNQENKSTEIHHIHISSEGQSDPGLLPL